jgi:hypothetical protein
MSITTHPCSISTLPNGWTDEFLCTEWFEKSFIPQATARNTSEKPILLILDGHGSHVTEAMRTAAVRNNIVLYCLPAHTTHRLQPLDVGVFGPLQRAWRDRCYEVAELTDAEIPKKDFIREYLAVRKKAFTKKNISDAWKHTGIHPWNPKVFSEEDFAPSRPNGVVPPSYPCQHQEKRRLLTRPKY